MRYPCRASHTGSRFSSQILAASGVAGSFDGARNRTTLLSTGDANRAARARKNCRDCLFPANSSHASTISFSASIATSDDSGAATGSDILHPRMGSNGPSEDMARRDRGACRVTKRRVATQNGASPRVTICGSRKLRPRVASRVRVFTYVSVGNPTNQHRHQPRLWSGLSPAEPESQDRRCDQGGPQ
jgi:hypothetical protein